MRSRIALYLRQYNHYFIIVWNTVQLLRKECSLKLSPRASFQETDPNALSQLTSSPIYIISTMTGLGETKVRYLGPLMSLADCDDEQRRVFPLCKGLRSVLILEDN